MRGQDEYVMGYNNKIDNTIQKANGEHRDILKGYLNHLRDSCAISTKYAYLKIIDRFYSFINKPVSEIVYEDYTEFLGSIEDKSSSYKITVHSALKLFSEYLLASKRNINNSMQFVKTSKISKSKEVAKKEKRLNSVLHEDEIKRYMWNVENGCGSKRSRSCQEEWKERDKCIIELFLTTGMRSSALYRLNVEDIDLKERTITTLEKRDKLRTFYLTDKAYICVEEWLLKRKALLNGISEDALFISNRMRRMDQSCIADVTKKYGVGIKNTSPHKLRATFGTQLLEKTNGDLNLVRIAMGHESVATTEIYMRRDERVIGRKVARMIEDII